MPEPPPPDRVPARVEAPPLDFSRAPFLVIWEVTRACALACVHCRADAIARRDARELTTAEGLALIDESASFERRPLLVLTGGDTMWRKDLVRLVGHAAAVGLTVALTPSGTAAASPRRLTELRDAGLSRVAVSLDGPDPATHDEFRRVRGSYDWTMRIIDTVLALGLPLQINTTVSRQTLPTLRATARRVGDFPLALWAVFFLVQTGRGSRVDQIVPEECEDVLEYLFDLSGRVPFGIKTTEAPHYRRVVWQHQTAAAWAGGAERPRDHGRRLGARRGVNDGNGFVFVDHVGDIYPSGFLPMVRGKNTSLVTTYRDDGIFRRLREPDALSGRWGAAGFARYVAGHGLGRSPRRGTRLARTRCAATSPGPMSRHGSRHLRYKMMG